MADALLLSSMMEYLHSLRARIGSGASSAAGVAAPQGVTLDAESLDVCVLVPASLSLAIQVSSDHLMIPIVVVCTDGFCRRRIELFSCL